MGEERAKQRERQLSTDQRLKQMMGMLGQLLGAVQQQDKINQLYEARIAVLELEMRKTRGK